MSSSCVKPDLNLIIGERPNPLCDEPQYLDACIVDAQFPEYPDVDSPFVCGCFNKEEDVVTNLAPYDPDPGSPTYNPNGSQFLSSCGTMDDFEVDVTMVLLNDNCCEPEYEFKITATLPCMPTEMFTTLDFSDPRIVDTEDPNYSEGSDLMFNVTKVCERYDEFGQLIAENLCEYDIDIRVPPLPQLQVYIKHTGKGIEYVRDCDVDDTKPGVTLDGSWEWNAVLQVRRLILELEIEFQVPMIGRLEDVPSGGSTDPLYVYKTVDVPTGDRNVGSAYLVPRVGDA